MSSVVLSSVVINKLVYQVFTLLVCYAAYQKVPVTAGSKTWVCSRSLAGTVSSNTAGGMDV